MDELEINLGLQVVDSETSLQNKYIVALLKVNPGLGEKSREVARDLVNSGLSSSEALLLIGAVYSPLDESGRGQGTRLKYFAKAVKERYGSELESIRGNVTSFRRFIMEMSDVTDMRDTLKEEGYSISFHETMLYGELGIDAEKYMALVQELRSEGIHNESVIGAKIRGAAMRVKADRSLFSLEAILFDDREFVEIFED